jgi:WD40 repeat protein/transcriptional regulator with XRE-family HTH domain
MDGSHEPESFRGLLLRHRGRTGLIQRDLAARVGVSLRAVQDWEAGVSIPTAERLHALTSALLDAGGFTPACERPEAYELWVAAERESPRMREPFDHAWFVGLLAARPSPKSAHGTAALGIAPAVEPATRTAEGSQDWGEAPDTTGFVGRAEELALLQTWVLDEHCRLVAVLGMGGIGKTSLAACLAQRVAATFECVYWRGLRNAPPVSDWLAGAIGSLSDQHVVPPSSESERINTLLQLLRARPCLLVLDNSETLFEPGQRESRYRADMDGYGRLFEAIGGTSHQSCLVLTSREAPPEMALLGGGVRIVELHGLGISEAQAVLADKQLIGSTQAWLSLVDRYSGNGLALKMVGETIRQVYDTDIAAFLRDAVAGYGTVFGGIRRLLDGQVERLSRVELDILTRLAIEREPISIAELAEDLPQTVDRRQLIEALENLRRRSVVERAAGGTTYAASTIPRAGAFTLQSMVLEYMTDRVVETVTNEIEQGVSGVLTEQSLIKAQAKEYVRQTQERLVGTPILQRLNAQHGEAGAADRLLALLEGWRGRPRPEQGYGPGNAVNLLRLLRGDLRGLDLSRLALRQVYLQGVEMQDASLAGTDLAGAVLDEPFAYPASVALSADGALLVAGTPNGEVRIWRVADRTLLLAAQVHIGFVWDVAISDDGRLVASAGEDGTVRLCDGESGHLLATLRGHTAGVKGVALSGDGCLVASASADGTVRLWSAQTAELQATFRGHPSGVRSVALSTDGRIVASGGDSGAMRLWDAQSGESLAPLDGHVGQVWEVAVSGDGRLAASGGEDGTVRLWDVASGCQLALATLHGHTAGVRALALSRDGLLVAGGGWEGTVRLWSLADFAEPDGKPGVHADVASVQLRATLLGHTGVVLRMALSGDARLLASTSFDGSVHLWEVASGHLIATLRGDTAAIRGVALSANGGIVASGGADGVLRLWQADSGRLLANLKGHTGAIVGVAISADGRVVASAGWDGSVRLWDSGSAQLLATLHGHRGGVRRVELSRDGRLLASGGEDGTVHLWSLDKLGMSGETAVEAGTMRGHDGVVLGLALTDDGRLVGSGGIDGTLRLWDATSGQLLATLPGTTHGVWAVALSGDGRLVASSGGDGVVLIRDTRSGELVADLRGHDGIVYGVGLSGDGQVIATGGEDRTIKLWDTRSGRLRATLEGHTSGIRDVALSADGRLAASGGDDGHIRLWNVTKRSLLRALRNDRHYQRLDITGLTGLTEAQRAALRALGAVEAPV